MDIEQNRLQSQFFAFCEYTLSSKLCLPHPKRVAGLSFPQLVHFIVVIPPVNDNLAA